MKPDLPSDDQIDAFLREDSVPASEHLNARLDAWVESLPASASLGKSHRCFPLATLGILSAGIAAVLVSIFWIGPATAPGSQNPVAVATTTTPSKEIILDEELFALLDLVGNVNPTVFEDPDVATLLAGNF